MGDEEILELSRPSGEVVYLGSVMPVCRALLPTSNKMRRPVTQESFLTLVIALLLLPVTAVGQHAGHHTGATGANTGSTTPPENPDVVTFEHGVALQARPDQVGQFNELVTSTATACTQAHDLQQHGAAANSVDLSQNATRLHDAVEDAQSENRKFVNSLSDVQVSGLKKLTTPLAKANSAVTKESKALAAQLEKVPVDSRRLISTVGQLEKALTTFQSDQLHLGQEMGIPTH